MTSATTPRPFRATLTQAIEHVAKRQPFVAGGGSMHGEVVTYVPTSTGRLDPAWEVELGTAICVARAAGGQTFVVWSYGTPIAWTEPDGSLTVPPVRYTTTTCKHQHAVRQALASERCRNCGQRRTPAADRHCLATSTATTRTYHSWTVR